MNYPDLNNSKIISFDIETYDPELIEKGPGVYRRDGNILGVSIANENGFSEYYNIGHYDCIPEEKSKNIKYIDHILKINCPKIGANILYDMDWIENWWKLKINGELNDVQVAEPLIDENRKLLGLKRPYSLDSLGQKYLGLGKQKTEIELFCEKNKLKGDPRKWLWKMPYELVRKYGKQDALLPIKIFKQQYSILKEQNLLPLYYIEMGLHRLLLQMRKVGVRTDKQKIQNGINKLNALIIKGKTILNKKYGYFNYNSSKQVAKIFDKLRIEYPLTNKGNPSITKEVLAKMEIAGIEIAKEIRDVKTADKILHTFFINSFHNFSILNRIHCSFFPLSTDKYGTKSGRFSSANPNLQQIPSRGIHKKLCRSVFIPEEGYDWIKLDYSQIEYRFIVHYSIGPKSDEVREMYNNNPKTDYHKMVMEWTGLDRPIAKNLNFGTAYFMGVNTCAEKFGWTLEQADNFLKLYCKEIPFIIPTRNHVVKVAKQRGYIKTILGRRARVTEQMRIMRKEHSMFNRLIQGSSADLLKKAMKESYDAGIFNTLIPHLTVHDELDVSKPRTKEGDEALKELKHIMETTIKLKVPIKVDVEIGSSWGSLEDYEC